MVFYFQPLFITELLITEILIMVTAGLCCFCSFCESVINFIRFRPYQNKDTSIRVKCIIGVYFISMLPDLNPLKFVN